MSLSHPIDVVSTRRYIMLCIYICMYIINLSFCLYTLTIHVHSRIAHNTCVLLYAYAHIHTHSLSLSHTHTHTRTHTHTHTHTRTHIIYTYIYIYMYICMYVYIYIYIYIGSQSHCGGVCRLHQMWTLLGILSLSLTHTHAHR
jgi:hypothetical protein